MIEKYKFLTLFNFFNNQFKKVGKGGIEPPIAQFRTEIYAEIKRIQNHTKLDHLPNTNISYN